MKLEKDNDIVSIIVPVFNLKDYILGCISSLLNQTYPHIEIIIVDDGSTDGSTEICDLLASSHKTIRVVHQKNKGVSSARNTGIDIASGEYIMFVDGDDAIVSNCVECLLSLLKINNGDFATCTYIDTFSVLERDMTARHYVPESIGKNYSSDAYLKLLLEQKKSPSSCEKLYRASIINDIRFDETIKINEDKLFQFNVLLNAKQIVESNAKLYVCLNRIDSASRVKSSFSLDQIIVSKLIVDKIEFKNLDELIPYANLNRYLTLVYSARLLARRHIKYDKEKEFLAILKKEYGQIKKINVKRPTTKNKIEAFFAFHFFAFYKRIVRCFFR